VSIALERHGFHVGETFDGTQCTVSYVLDSLRADGLYDRTSSNNVDFAAYGSFQPREDAATADVVKNIACAWTVDEGVWHHCSSFVSVGLPS
jgi:hypothetical protein